MEQQAFTMSNCAQSLGLSLKFGSQHVHVCAGARAMRGLWRPVPGVFAVSFHLIAWIGPFS